MCDLVRADPRLQGMATAVRTEVHEGGIGLAVGSSRDPVETWIREPRWWEPMKRSRAKELHARLAGALLALVGSR